VAGSELLHVPGRRALRIGAAATLKEIEEVVAPHAASSSSITALLDAIHNFGWGGAQLRASASLGGSVVFAPTYSNFVPLLCALVRVPSTQTVMQHPHSRIQPL
jgi:CO/xanthine dehydrogenase FAD-binding subunit